MKDNGTATRIEVVDPWTAQTVGSRSVSDRAQVDAAVTAARSAAAGWAALPAQERAAKVGEGAHRLRVDIDEVAWLNTLELGRPTNEAANGVRAAVDTASMYAQLGPVHRGRSLVGANDAVDLMRHVPRGVVAVVVPWNDPVAIAVQGVAAALVTGNTVVVKPSERAPLAVEAALAHFDHLPDGVLTVLHGDAGTGRALVEHSDVDCVVLTGSVAAGREVARVAADRGAHTVLELGGNDALIVDDGVDPVWAAEQAAIGSFTNAGQICTSVERILVHRSVADEFLDALVEHTRLWQPGDPTDSATRMGPLVDHSHRERVHAMVLDAVAGGADALTGGVVPPGASAAYPPTVLTGIARDAAVLQQETFGPVAPVVVVDSWDEAVHLANDVPHGLAATVLTPDTARALSAADRLRVGTVKVNAVFGGAPGGAAHPRGVSGDALGYGPELLDELTQVQVLHLEACP